MTWLSIQEVIDIIIITAAVGFIFSDFFKIFMKSYHKGHHHIQGHIPASELDHILETRFDWKAFCLSAIITVPAIVLHEFGHKFVANAFGLSATFHAAYFWLGIGILLRLLNFKFIFFVPAYVAISNGLQITPAASTATAFAGPAVNLILFLIAIIAMKHIKTSQRTYAILYFTKQINLFLFIFNMIPLPLFDGFKVYQGLYHLLF